jgi:hypothetical protein
VREIVEKIVIRHRCLKEHFCGCCTHFDNRQIENLDILRAEQQDSLLLRIGIKSSPRNGDVDNAGRLIHEDVNPMVSPLLGPRLFRNCIRNFCTLHAGGRLLRNSTSRHAGESSGRAEKGEYMATRGRVMRTHMKMAYLLVMEVNGG